jgi:RNA polymerase sigma-70 factor, ECF subfamily
MDPRSDYELAQAVSHGAVSSLGDLYERHRRRVYTLCLRMTGNAYEAEDLTHDIFIQLIRKVGTFRGESQFRTWLHRLTINQVLMHFRRPIRRKESRTMHKDIYGELLPPPVVKHSWGKQAADQIDLEIALAKLPPGCRSVFLKFDVEGYNHEEIARIFGFSTGNSKSQLHKARRKLRKLLAPGNTQSLRAPIKRMAPTP